MAHGRQGANHLQFETYDRAMQWRQCRAGHLEARGEERREGPSLMRTVMQEARGQSSCSSTRCGQRHESPSERLRVSRARCQPQEEQEQEWEWQSKWAWARLQKSDCLLRSLNLIYGQREPAGVVEANKSSRWTETTDTEVGKPICRPVRH